MYTYITAVIIVILIIIVGYSYYYASEGYVSRTFVVGPTNNKFRFIDERPSYVYTNIYTVTIPSGVYTGEQLAIVLKRQLDKAQQGIWTVHFNASRGARFTFEHSGRYYRYPVANSIYRLVGLSVPNPVIGPTKTEIGNNIV